MSNGHPTFSPTVPSKNIINVLRNRPKNIDIAIKVRIFLIGKIFFKKLVKPKPRIKAIGISSRNFRDGTKIPSPNVIPSTTNDISVNSNLVLFLEINSFM